MLRVLCSNRAKAKRAAAADVQCCMQAKAIPDAASEAKSGSSEKGAEADWAGDGSEDSLPGVWRAYATKGARAEAKDVQ
jgi:hypothetical protein